MKTITKHFDTLKQAERYQSRLYNLHDSVQLQSAPMFSEAGTYRWNVSSTETTEAYLARTAREIYQD